MIRANVHDAKTHLSRYLAKVKKGETIILCKNNEPIAEIRPLPTPLVRKRPIGLAKGQLKVPPEFFEPLPEGAIQAFQGETQ